MMVSTAPLAAAVMDPSVSLPVVSPAAVLVLCAAAGLATAFTLPGHREASVRRLAGLGLGLCGLVLVALMPLLSGFADSVYFWIFSAVALASAVRVVTHPRPVYSALYFVLTVFASAGLFVLLQAEFMAAALVLIYAGAILVTYVFVIMLASGATGGAPADGPLAGVADYDRTSRDPITAAAVGFGLMAVLLTVVLTRAPATMNLGAAGMPTADGGPTEGLGTFLFRSQLVQLEVAGILLLVSMVGAIVISRRQVKAVPTDGESTDDARTAAGQVPEVVNSPATPTDDNPHSIPVHGTDNPRQKAYPQT